jgi:hypothetical protein
MGETEETRAIQSIDDVFAAAGLTHGRRTKRLDEPPVAKKLRASSGERIEVLRVGDWAKLKWLRHGFSARLGGTSNVYSPNEDRGELNLGFTADDDAGNVSENRRIFLNAVTGGKKSELIVLRQIHSSLTRRVGVSDLPIAMSGDGLMTDEPGVMLGVLTADCIPILIADRKKRAVAAFHAGWRGTLKRIVESGVGRMRLEFGSKPEDLIAAIGPGIGSCCYAVGEDLRHEFESQFAYASKLFHEVSDADPVKQKYPMLFMTARAPGHSDLGPSLHLDLAEANRRQLIDAGLKRKRIAMLDQCTSCHPERFFSHRQQQGFTGRMMAVIGVRG